MARIKAFAIAVFTVLVIASLNAVAAQEATQDGWTISGSDTLCSVGTCYVYPRICNDQNTSRSFDLAFDAPGLTPFAAASSHDVTYTRQVWVPNVVAMNTTTVSIENGSQTSTIYVDNGSYVNQTYTQTEWQSSSNLSLGGSVLQSSSISFAGGECKVIQVAVSNVIGGSWKYGVNFLDPFINSTNYEIGSVTNSTNTWDADENTTISTIALSVDKKSFTLTGSSPSPSILGNTTIYYSFDNISGSSLTDLTGAHTGTLTGTYTNNKTLIIGQATQFSNGYINTGYTAPSHNSFTICTWINITAAGSVQPIAEITGQFLFAANYTGWGCAANKYCFITWSPGQDSVISTSTVVVGTPKYVCGTHDEVNNQNRIYVNGVNEGNTTSSSAMTVGAINFGTQSSGTVNLNSATLDEMGLWYGKAFNQSEVTSLYNNGNGLQYPFGNAFNTSTNYYESKQIALATNLATFVPIWNALIGASQSVSVNVTCDANDPTPVWTGILTNNTVTNCPVQGTILKYSITLNGSIFNSPTMLNFTIVFGTIANETNGRQAILNGIAASTASSGTVYTDQQVYARLANGTQTLGTFDEFLVAGNKRYAFNYDQNTSASFPTFYNITPVLYVWQAYNLTTAQIQASVTQFISSTY